MAQKRGNGRMLTASEVAERLHVHINTIRRWSNNGVITAYRIGPRGDRRFREQDIDNFLKVLTSGNKGDQAKT